MNSSNTADVYRRHIEDVCQMYDKYSFSRVIFTSSVSVFDYYSTGLISEYSEPRPSSDYSSLKIELEKLHFRNNLFTEVHYLSALCGKSMPSTFLKNCIYAVRENELPKVNSLSDYFNGLIQSIYTRLSIREDYCSFSRAALESVQIFNMQSFSH